MTRILFLSALSALAVVALTPPAGAAELVSLTRQPLAPRSSLENAAIVFPGERWWLAYGDDQLSALIAQALGGVPSLDAASARVRAAWPAPLPKPGEKHGPDPAALDRWRRDRAGLAAAASEDEAARLERAQAQLLLTTGVVRAYAEFWRLAADLDAARARVGRGEPVTPLERQAVAALDREVGGARSRLAVLVGGEPDPKLYLPRPSGARPIFQLPSGRLEQLISQRPDLQAARWRAAAAEAHFAATRASALSRLSLSALLGPHALGLNHFVSLGSDIGQTGLGLWSPNLDGDPGADLDAARLKRDAAANEYERALLGALHDVAHATSDEQAVERRLSAAQRRLVQAEAVCQTARSRFAAGLGSRAALLAAEDTRVARRTLVAGVQARRLIADAALVHALGAGISEPAH